MSRSPATIGVKRHFSRERGSLVLRKRQISPHYATAADAVRYLASVCDGAILRDGHGFSSDHTAYGHWLALLPDVQWGPPEHTGAHQIVRIYQQQLARAGFQPVDIIRRRRPRKISRRAALQLQPGWAQDPSGIHAWRWWNGARWTENVATLTPHVD